MALATLGGTVIAGGSILPRHPERSRESGDDGPECFSCHRSGRGTRLLRFGLEYRPPGKGGRGRKVGSILLCEKCWRDTR